MRGLLKPLLVHFLRRDPGEISERARGFDIRGEERRALVARLGSAFISGYNAMLQMESLVEVAREGMRTDAHFRPFFFEGAAMGYLPSGYFRSGRNARRAERDLMGMHPGFSYLYYVGLGFWFGFRHPARPSSLNALAAHLDPMYFPLCYDGFGFKLGFFDYRTPAGSRRRLDRCPPEHRSAIYQGFGRALFFVFMDDEPGFNRVRDALPLERREDLELGRSLALAFTHADKPEILAAHLTGDGEADLAARLTGVTWALTARELHDPDYFRDCMRSASPQTRDLLGELPAACRRALSDSGGYFEWQRKTRTEVTAMYLERHSSMRSKT